MDLQLTGKRALITGSSIGIGEEIAGTLATEGATVIVHGRDRERADLVAADLVSRGGKAIAIPVRHFRRGVGVGRPTP